jgi:hypothetical protein
MRLEEPDTTTPLLTNRYSGEEKIKPTKVCAAIALVVNVATPILMTIFGKATSNDPVFYTGVAWNALNLCGACSLGTYLCYYKGRSISQYTYEIHEPN